MHEPSNQDLNKLHYAISNCVLLCINYTSIKLIAQTMVFHYILNKRTKGWGEDFGEGKDDYMGLYLCQNSCNHI